MKPTREQYEIVVAAKSGNNLRIQAYAGTGKTSTLVFTANELDKTSLYLAYNKAMADEAKNKFPDHVEVRTTHSLAYSRVGHNYHHKLSRPRGKYVNVGGTGGEIARLFKIKDLELSGGKKITAAAIGLCIKETVNRFEYSAEDKIGIEHLPTSLINDFSRRKGFDEQSFKRVVLKFAKQLWSKRTDVNSEILCTHDTYMKLFQLSKPKLTEYEVIYLDEAQDSNACLLDIFLNQKHAQLICVGDSLQAIYQWRGSINAMELLDFEQRKLTQSFRFGQGIADIATKVLRDKKTGELVHNVKGLGSIKSIASDEQETVGEGTYTILYRTNAMLLSDAVHLIGKGKKINIETDMADFVRMLQSAVALYQGKTKDVKHENIVPFSVWEELIDEAKTNGELDRIAMIITSGSALKYISVLENHYNTKDAEIVLTTAHKSKGREFDKVILADDFPSPYDQDDRFVGLEDAERNLLYVACTRAKNVLVYNESVIDMISTAGVPRVNSVSITKYSGKYKTPIRHSKSDGAVDAINRATDNVDLYQRFMNGEFSLDEAYEMGIIDENGASIDSTDKGLNCWDDDLDICDNDYKDYFRN